MQCVLHMAAGQIGMVCILAGQLCMSLAAGKGRHRHKVYTWPGLGTGNLCNLKELALYRCVVSFSKFFGKLMIMMASKGHFCKTCRKFIIITIEVHDF